MKKYIIYIVCALAGLQSCLDIKLDNQFSDPYAITTTATARELLASAYNSLPRFQFELAILGDDFRPTNYANQYAELLNLYQWQDKAIEDLSSLVWNEYYLTISYLNTLLTRLDKVIAEGEDDAAELEKLRAEALTMKAYCYFDLLRLYAPACSESNMGKDAIILKNRLELDFLPRSSLKVCVAEIDGLLAEAAKISNEAAPVYYLGSEAVAALRTEFELYRGAYDKAIEYGLPLLDGIEQKLNRTDYKNLWTANASAERIFAPYIFNTFYIDMSYDKERGDYFKLAPEVSYDDADIRKECCEYQGPQTASRSLGKYNKMYYENIEVRYINTLRYSGVLFAVAEAYARDNQEAKARELLNVYLLARGLSELGANVTGKSLIERILSEKQKEFVGEGTRYYDLKRTGEQMQRYDVSGKLILTLAPDDYRHLFPIPQSEYKYNDKITENNQNPGWSYEKTN